MDDSNQFRRQRTCFVCVFFIVLTSISVIAFEEGALPPAPFPQCPENEFYKLCLGNCSNCEQRGRCPVYPTMECQSGCDCIPYYVRLTPGGKCEPISKCPILTCAENEIFRPCGPTCERCGTLRCRILRCDYMCYCKEGFLRNHEGKCIPEDECPPRTRCTIGEKLDTSGLVDEYCLHGETEVVTNATENKERCYCGEGLKRNAMGHCTSEDFCQFVRCRNIEKYNNCPSNCNTTCNNYGDPNCVEDGQCYPGCFCPEGTVMNDHRICVPVENCPPGSNPFAPTVAPISLELQTETSISDFTTSIAVTKAESVTDDDILTTRDEDTSTNSPTENGKGDDAGLKSIVFDLSTTAYETTQKPKPGKQGKSRSTSEAKAESGKNPTTVQNPVNSDLEDEDENE